MVRARDVDVRGRQVPSDYRSSITDCADAPASSGSAVAGAAIVSAPPMATNSGANPSDTNDIVLTVHAAAHDGLGYRCERPANCAQRRKSLCLPGLCKPVVASGWSEVARSFSWIAPS